MPDLTCIESPIDGDAPKQLNGCAGIQCAGTVELRESLTGTGMPIARCAAHWTARLAFQREHDRRYPVQAPADFDPMYAGERWDEDY